MPELKRRKEAVTFSGDTVCERTSAAKEANITFSIVTVGKNYSATKYASFFLSRQVEYDVSSSKQKAEPPLTLPWSLGN